jgi:signal transduction histidine kinase
MTRPLDLAARHAWRAAFAAAVLNATGMAADFLLARGLPAMPVYPYVMSAAVGIALILVLLIRRQSATVRLGSAVFMINTLALLVGLWITSGYWAATGSAWTPFQANKLGALAVAMLAPQLSVGLASIAGFTAVALGKFYFLDPDIQRGFPVGEPWLILIYALFAGVLLVFRVRGLAIEREMLRLQAEAAASDQLARTFLRLSDYANTPIQTIAFATELLRTKNRDDLQPVLDRLKRAVERLRELSDTLTRHQNGHHWSPGEESLDSGHWRAASSVTTSHTYCTNGYSDDSANRSCVMLDRTPCRSPARAGSRPAGAPRS